MLRKDWRKVTAPCLALPLLGYAKDLKPVFKSLGWDGNGGGEMRVLRGQAVILCWFSDVQAHTESPSGTVGL